MYKDYAMELINKDKAYYCFATKKELDEMREASLVSGSKQGYDRRYRNLSKEEVEKRLKNKEPYVIRLKVPLTGECIFEDGIKGTITTPNCDVDDQIILKSDGFPTYHLANVVDDHLMKITHVIRGDEWISSTPKHIHLYEAFGWEKPQFLHMPLLLGKDGKKLSKRKNPTSTFYFRDTGYLPEALTNFLTLMGYSSKDEKEICSFKEFYENFDVKRIGTSSAFFDIQKLDWINKQYIINNLSEDSLLEKLKSWQFNDEFFKKLMPLAHSRITNFSNFIELFDFMFTSNLKYTEEMFVFKDITKEKSSVVLYVFMILMEKLDTLQKESVEKLSHEVADLFQINHKKVVIPLLFAAIMGKLFGPPLYASCEILGKDRVRARLLKVLEFLNEMSNKKIAKIQKQLEKNDLSEWFRS